MVKTDGPGERVARWLRKFARALEASDVEAAAALFHKDCYWRDLVAFTWNIKTMEGRAAVAAMLAARLEDVGPSGWAAKGEATETDEIVAGWFGFETQIARGEGHIRLRGGKCWTLLTSMIELKGFEEKRGPTRVMGAQHGVVKGRETWGERKARGGGRTRGDDAALLPDRRRRPGRRRAGRPAQAARRSHHHRRQA